ncbi:MAG TPA: LamG-like jellyroll fold domain-containing protein [Flavobacteriales bacterium]|nr:LamG-like jellyroll fold domain-containing protein [Flavobacteriales bacterium]
MRLQSLLSLLIGLWVMNSCLAQGSGNALDFDGTNDVVEVKGTFPNMTGGSFSICAWIMTTNNTKAGQRIFADDQQSSGTGGYALSLGDPGTARLRFYCRALPTVSLDVPVGNYQISNNVWYHVAAVHDGTARTRRIYVNGELAASDGPYTAGAWAGTEVDNGPASIGGETSASTETANRLIGREDEVSFWTKALSQTEIRDLMCKSLTGSEANLIGYWNFDAAALGADGVPDLTSNGYHGTMTNMVAGDVVTSAAAIGNTSTYVYTTAWAGVNLYLQGPEGDSLRVSSVSSATVNCIHIYNVNSVPNTTTGITGLGGNNQYFGVFKSVYFGGAGTYTATYHYRQNDAYEASTVADLDYVESSIRCFTRSNNSFTPWTKNTTAPVTTSKTITMTAMSTEFILGYDNALANLPIELVSFNAWVNGDKVDIAWSTASEINNNYFTIERSKGGTVWEEIAKIEGAGNSNQRIDYFDVDYSPFKGTSYYRLKQTDFDGKFSYSQIAVVKNGNLSFEGDIIPFPNPTDGNSFNLEFTGFGDEEVFIVMRDIQGKSYYSNAYMINDHTNIVAVLLNEKLPAGTYLITASTNENFVSKQIIVR